jgi:hypothetical protein
MCFYGLWIVDYSLIRVEAIYINLFTGLYLGAKRFKEQTQKWTCTGQLYLSSKGKTV